jgi:Trk-type K+ transport system membrane component
VCQVCIVERTHIQNPDQYSYFSVFAVIFEVASAYANVGFSLGVPYVRPPRPAFFPPCEPC